MVKSELLRSLHQKLPYLQFEQVESAVNNLLKHIEDALVQGEHIEVRGFGCFDLRHHVPRIARNPKTGEAVDLPARVAIRFKPGKNLKNRVNASHDQCEISE